MSKTISAAEANRQFSAILRGVREGERYVVTSHGKAVARIVPMDDEAAARETARENLFTRLRKQKAIAVGKWTRDELYNE